MIMEKLLLSAAVLDEVNLLSQNGRHHKASEGA